MGEAEAALRVIDGRAGGSSGAILLDLEVVLGGPLEPELYAAVVVHERMVAGSRHRLGPSCELAPLIPFAERALLAAEGL